MKNRNGRLVEARFADMSFTMIRACYKDYSDPKNPTFNIQMYSYDPNATTQSKEVQEILKEYPVYSLEKNYHDFNKAEEWKWRMYQTFLERADEIIPYIESGITPEIVEAKPINLQTIRDIGNNPEDFFKLKLEIFELDEVKSSKNRQWKAKMRKATTTLELLSLLYEVYSTVENESGERLDETPVQETATPLDNAS